VKSIDLIHIVVELEKQDLFFMIGNKQDLEEQLGSNMPKAHWLKMSPTFYSRRAVAAVYLSNN